MFAKELQRSLLVFIGVGFVAQLGLMAQYRNGSHVSRNSEAKSDITWDRASEPQSDGQVNGPVLGFVFDQQSGVTPLLGISGATIWGTTIPVPDLTEAAVSVEGNYAFGLSAKDGRPRIIRNLLGPVTDSEMENGFPSDGFALSPSGSAAVVRQRTTGQVRVIVGLPGAPVTLWVESFRTIPGELDLAAVPDDGQSVVGIVTNGERRFLVVLTRFGGWRYLMALEGSASVSYLRGASDAVVVDQDANQALLIRNVGGNSTIVPIAGQREGISRPIAVRVTADNRHAIVANADPQGVAILGLTDGTAQTVPSPCASVGLQQLAGNSVFLLQRAADSQLCLFDGDSSPPRVLVVPPPGDDSVHSGVSQ